MNKKHKFLFISMLAIIGVSALAVSSYSLAAYVSRRKISQGIKSDGKLGSLVYLDATEWENEGNPTFRMRVWNTDGTKTVRHIAPKGKTSSGYYTFELKSEYNRLMFVRCNPNANTDYFADSANCFAAYSEDAETVKVIWNKTGDLEYSSSNPLFTITGYGSEKFYSVAPSPLIGVELGTISSGSWSSLT